MSATIETLTRALTESQAERDRLHDRLQVALRDLGRYREEANDAVSARDKAEEAMWGHDQGLAAVARERDKLAKELANARQELDIYKHWVSLDDDDAAVVVVCDVDHEEASWCAVFRDREQAERFVVLAREDDDEAFSGANFAALDGTTTAEGMNLWNSYDPVKRPESGGDA